MSRSEPLTGREQYELERRQHAEALEFVETLLAMIEQLEGRLDELEAKVDGLEVKVGP